MLGSICHVVKGEPRDFFSGPPRPSKNTHVDDRVAVGHIVQNVGRAKVDRDAPCDQRIVHLLADVVVVFGVFHGDAKLVGPQRVNFEPERATRGMLLRQAPGARRGTPSGSSAWAILKTMASLSDMVSQLLLM